jgi:hypothetical protein
MDLHFLVETPTALGEIPPIGELRRIDTAQHALISELEDSASSDNPAIKAYRARIRERFTGLQNERTTTTAELDALTTAALPIEDPTLLDELPLLPGLLDEAPQKLIAGLLEAFSVQAIYNKKVPCARGDAATA